MSKKNENEKSIRHAFVVGVGLWIDDARIGHTWAHIRNSRVIKMDFYDEKYLAFGVFVVFARNFCDGNEKERVSAANVSAVVTGRSTISRIIFLRFS